MNYPDRMLGFVLGFGFTVVVFLVIGTQADGFFQTVTQRVVVSTTTVSVIAEKQGCDKDGGELELIVNNGTMTNDDRSFVVTNPSHLEISCTKEIAPITYFDITAQ